MGTMSTPPTDTEMEEFRHALPDGGRASQMANRLCDEIVRLRTENASLKVHPEGYSAETMTAMTDELKRSRALIDRSLFLIDDYAKKLKAVDAALEKTLEEIRGE
jgi:hypothetical protein